MGLDAEIKVKMLFRGEQIKQALNVFRWLASTRDDFNLTGGVAELSFRRARLKNTGLRFDPVVYVVTLEHANDRNFWVERYGLKQIVENVADPALNCAPPAVGYDWYKDYSGLAVKLGCAALETDAFCVDNLHWERRAVDRFGETLLAEEDNCRLVDDPAASGGLAEKYDNPDYGKKTLEELVAERWAEYELKTAAAGEA